MLGYEGDPTWMTELVEELERDRVAVIDDSTGDGTVERIVDASLSTLNRSASLVFMALGVVPEDVPVTIPVARIICGADPEIKASGVKLNTMTLRRSIKSLLDRNLLQGSTAHGFQQHDIGNVLLMLASVPSF